jgi:hypothetical protein
VVVRSDLSSALHPAAAIRLLGKFQLTAIVNDLKTAAELLEKAAELLHEAAKQSDLPSEATRQSVREEIGRIRLKLFLLRRDLTMLHSAANRRKPQRRPL